MLNILFYFCFSAMVLGSLPLWTKLFRHKHRTGSLLNQRETNGTAIGFIDIIVMFFFWVGGQGISLAVAAALLGISVQELPSAAGDTKSWAAILIALGQLSATAAAVVFFLARYRRLDVIGWQSQSIKPDLTMGLLAFVMVIPGLLLFQFLLVKLLAYEHPTMEMLSKNANGLTLAAAWLSAVIVAPICEEIFFRGVLQSWLQRLGRGGSDQALFGGWDSQISGPAQESETDLAANEAPTSPGKSPITTGKRQSWISDAYWPIVVTSILFGLAHFGQGPAPISLFVFGLVLGYLFRKTGSILPCIVLHMMLNAFTMFWFTLRVFFEDAEMAPAVDVAASIVGL